jgi:hypothetical protein
MRKKEELLAGSLLTKALPRREDLEEALRILAAEEDAEAANAEESRRFEEAREARQALAELIPAYIRERDQVLMLARDFTEKVARLAQKRPVIDQYRQVARRAQFQVHVPDSLAVESTKPSDYGELRRVLEAVTKAAQDLRSV